MNIEEKTREMINLVYKNYQTTVPFLMYIQDRFPGDERPPSIPSSINGLTIIELDLFGWYKMHWDKATTLLS